MNWRKMSERSGGVVYDHCFRNHGHKLSEVCIKCGYERTIVWRTVALANGAQDINSGCMVPPPTRIQYVVAWVLTRLIGMALWFLRLGSKSRKDNSHEE